MKLPKRAYGASVMDLSSSGGQGAKLPRNSLFGHFPNDVKVCIGFYHVSVKMKNIKKLRF
jgi:hypothetical protein